MGGRDTREPRPAWLAEAPPWRRSVRRDPCPHADEATGEDAATALDLLTAVDGPLVRVTADAASVTVAVYETATARGGVGALIQRGGRAVAGMLTIATAGGS